MSKRERDRAEEMQTHVELYVDELIARGRTPEEARREARLAFGNPRAKLEEVHQMSRLPVLDALWRDAKYAVRVLRRTPAFTATAVVTLALVIGANSAVFSLADAILLKPLPYPHPERLAVLGMRLGLGPDDVDPSQDGRVWEAVHGHLQTLDCALGAGNFGHNVNLVTDNIASSVGQWRVSAGYFRVLGVAPAIGREFAEEEDRVGGGTVAVLSYPLWQRLFHGDTGAIGRSILLRGESYQVVGVMPEGFQGPAQADVWTPARPSRTGEGGGNNYQVIARVRDGHTWAEADGELATLTPILFPPKPSETGPPAFQRRLELVRMQDALVDGVRQPIEMLAAAVGMVLLIACVNLAALLISRGGSRTKEIATRMALGSGRGVVVRQLMVESAVLGLAGGALGLAVGAIALEGLKALGGETFSEWTRVSLDGRVLAATMGLSLVTSLIFGLVPSLQASRLDVNAALTEGGSRAIAGGSRQWLRRGLIVAEVALGVVLLVVTALLIRTFVNLRSLDPGFEPSQLATAAISLQDARYQTADQVNRLFDASLAELKRMPGIESAAVSLELPYKRLLNYGFRFVDAPPDAPGGMTNVMYITPEFFKTFRIPLRSGRAFASDDVAGSPPVAIVNETFVRAWNQGKDPIGRRIRSGKEFEIVGVVGDVQVTDPGINFPGRPSGPNPLMTSPLLFVPATQETDGFMKLVHTWFTPIWSVRASSSVNVAAAIQQAFHAVDPLLPVGRVEAMADVQANAIAQPRLLMILVGVLTATAILLAALGIHGILSHAISERRREFGIRLALGATAGQTMRQVAMSGVMLAAVGAAIGMGLAWAAVRLVESFLFGVASHDLSTYVSVARFLLLVATVASFLPALKILRVDPAETLRA